MHSEPSIPIRQVHENEQAEARDRDTAYRLLLWGGVIAFASGLLTALYVARFHQIADLPLPTTKVLLCFLVSGFIGGFAAFWHFVPKCSALRAIRHLERNYLDRPKGQQPR